MTRITVVTRVTPMHDIGGMQQIAWDLARTWSQRGHEVRFLTTTLPDQAGNEPTRVDGMEVFTAPRSTPGRLDALWWTAADGVYSQHLSDTQAMVSVGIGASRLFARTDAPPVRLFQCHGTLRDELPSRRPTGRGPVFPWHLRRTDPRFLLRERRILQAATDVVAVGPRVHGTLQHAPYKGPSSGAKLHLIPNGIDTSVFHPGSARRRAVRRRLGVEDLMVAFTAARFVPDKAVHLAIHAFAKLARHRLDAVHLLLGGGPEEERLRSLVAELGLQERVRFLGRVPREDVPDMYRAADAFLFTPYRREGHPLNVLEALATGLPVVLSDHVVDETLPQRAIWPVPCHDAGRAALALDQALQTGPSDAPLLPHALTLEGCADAYERLLVRTGA